MSVVRTVGWREYFVEVDHNSKLYAKNTKQSVFSWLPKFLEPTCLK